MSFTALSPEVTELLVVTSSRPRIDGTTCTFTVSSLSPIPGMSISCIVHEDMAARVAAISVICLFIAVSL